MNSVSIPDHSLCPADCVQSPKNFTAYEASTVRYITEPDDPMWREHQRTLDPNCTCEYEKIQNLLWETLAIRRDVDSDCQTHGPAL